MSKAVHGGNIEELSRIYNLDKSKLLDFSANINPLFLSSKKFNKVRFIIKSPLNFIILVYVSIEYNS